MSSSSEASGARKAVHRLLVVTGAVFLTAVFFMVLPFIQAISESRNDDVMVRSVETALPPPETPLIEEPETEPEKEEEPPKLVDEAPPLDLSQLELALNPVGGEGWLGGDFAAKLGSLGSGGGGDDALFSLADLDQRPRVTYQPSPVLNAAVRKKAPGTVYIIFIVDERGRVESPIIQKSTDPAFEGPALSALKKWRFEPGKRSGKAVRFRMRVPITFPEG